MACSRFCKLTFKHNLKLLELLLSTVVVRISQIYRIHSYYPFWCNRCMVIIVSVKKYSSSTESSESICNLSSRSIAISSTARRQKSATVRGKTGTQSRESQLLYVASRVQRREAGVHLCSSSNLFANLFANLFVCVRQISFHT